MQCPLCESFDSEIFFDDLARTDKKFNMMRTYYQCHRCDLIYLDPKMFPNKDLELVKYNEHTNNPEEIGYRNFLNTLISPLEKKLSKDAQGLDFGSGPGPTLSVIFKELGYQVEDYDLYFKNDLELLEKQYDFITSTEVFEHFFKPKKEIEKLLSLLRPNGHLGIMTKLHTENVEFLNWYYRRDPTHVIFFTEKTFNWIAKNYNLSLDIISDNVMILQKNS